MVGAPNSPSLFHRFSLLLPPPMTTSPPNEPSASLRVPHKRATRAGASAVPIVAGGGAAAPRALVPPLPPLRSAPHHRSASPTPHGSRGATAIDRSHACHGCPPGRSRPSSPMRRPCGIGRAGGQAGGGRGCSVRFCRCFTVVAAAAGVLRAG